MNNDINHLSAKVTFWAGFSGGALSVLSLGFVILLVMVVRGGGLPLVKTRSGVNPSVQGTAVAPTPSPSNSGTGAPSGPITLRDVANDEHIRGDKNAPVTLVEYSDTECPFCKRFHPTMQQVVENYKGKVRWVYRHFPLTSLHPKASKEAEATECAAELGGNDKFWAYLDRIYEITPSNNGLEESQLPKIAEDVGLNRQKFEDCLSSGKYAKKVQSDAQDAQNAGGAGTPYSVVIGLDGTKTPISGAQPYEAVKAAIDAALGSGKS